METIRLVLDKPLLAAANREARKAKINRSALIRRALNDYLKRRREEEMWERERQAYLKQPITAEEDEEAAAWFKVQAWPEE